MLLEDSLTGDFNGDGLADVASRTTAGELWVATSTGSELHAERWTTSWPTNSSLTQFLVGDFNGDGRDDVAAQFHDAFDHLAWLVSVSTDRGFVTKPWGTWDSSLGLVDVVVGDFDGDGKDDIAGRGDADGWWWVSRSTGDRFEGSYWGRWSPFTEWNDVIVGDFDGDGRSDILGRSLENNTWWIASSQGDRFHVKLWAKWAPEEQWLDVRAGDINGDGRLDIVGRAASSGVWWYSAVTDSNVSRLPLHQERLGPQWNADMDWLLVAMADMNGDAIDDIVHVTDGIAPHQPRSLARFTSAWACGAGFQPADH